MKKRIHPQADTAQMDAKESREALEALIEEQANALREANRRLEEEIGKRERYEKRNVSLDNILEDSLNEIYVFNADDLRFVHVNRGARENLGYTEQELESLTPHDIKPEFDPDSFNALLEPLRRGTQKQVVFTTMHRRKDGSTYPIEAHLQKSACDQKKVFVAIILDISRSEQAKEELRLFRSLIDHTNDAIFINDAETGRVLDVNKRACEYLGYTREELTQMKVPDFDIIIRDDSFWEEHNRELCETGTALLESRHRRKDGSSYPVEINISRVRMNERYYNLGVARDISERKRTEEMLKSAKEAAEAADRAKSTFIANISHELRTPLNAILGFSQLLRHDKTLSGAQMEKIGTIYKSSEHLLSLINDVLEVSKIEAGHTAINRSTFDIYSLIEDITDMFSIQTESKKLQLAVETEEQLPRYLICDEGKLRQVLINLIGNAIKFTDRGAVSVKVGFKPQQQQNLVIEVADTGAGISPQEIDNIFFPFMQSRSGTDKGGTGLGLTIARKCAKLMDGYITASSEPSQGSSFIFGCIVQIGEDEDIVHYTPEKRVLSIAPSQNVPTLLVADNAESNRRVLAEILGAVGYKTLEASSAQEAVDIFNSERPHLILMGMRMPGMNGAEAIQKIKSDEPGSKTPVIIVSSDVFEEQRQTALPGGADEFIRKPFKEEEVYRKVARLLGVKYLYETQKEVKRQDKPQPHKLDQLLIELLEAVKGGYISSIKGLIFEVYKLEPILAKQLKDLTDIYAYDKLSAVLTDALEYDRAAKE